MDTDNYINLHFSDEKIRITVLTNICRMLLTRGYMDKKYKTDMDIIDNNKFLPFIETRTDNNIYTIPLDTPYKDQRENSSEFEGNSVIVKIIPHIVKDVSNSPVLNDFFKTFNKHHVIIVFDGMDSKVYTSLTKKKNVEVFDRDSLMIDLMSHVCAPVSCQLVTEDDISYITNLKISKILENDPLCKYYNGKKPMILRIIRPSLNNSIEIAYRKIIEQKAVFANKK